MLPITLGVIIAIWSSGPTSVVLADSTGQPRVLAPVRTGKERLTDKASDEQRVDDCKVPPARRTRERPSGCPAQ
jgi:hypothetical protein